MTFRNKKSKNSNLQLTAGLQFLLNNRKVISEFHSNSKSLMISLIDSFGLDCLSNTDLHWLESAKRLFKDSFLITVGDNLLMDHAYKFVSKPEFLYRV